MRNSSSGCTLPRSFKLFATLRRTIVEGSSFNRFRGRHISRALATHLPQSYPDAVDVLLRSLGPEHATDELIGAGMAPFYYLPHTIYVAERGLEHFDLSMHAQYELTKRFSAESSIRPYIARDPERAFAMLQT